MVVLSEGQNRGVSGVRARKNLPTVRFCVPLPHHDERRGSTKAGRKWRGNVVNQAKNRPNRQ